MKRRDLFELLEYAKSLGLSFALSPAVTQLLTYDALKKLKESGVSAVSVSLDGASAKTHESIRREPGTFDRTVLTMKRAVEIGLKIQVNTAVMKSNLLELPDIYNLIKGIGVKTWELFFLIKVGRGSKVEDISPIESEAVGNFLYDCSLRGMLIRTVEAPFVRRIADQRKNDPDYNFRSIGTYSTLHEKLQSLDGLNKEAEAGSNSTLARVGTLDGDGIVFVSYDGTIYPGGLLPISLGNVKSDTHLVSTYRDTELLKKIRSRAFQGPCGDCKYKEVCGGSRARSYSYYGDPLSSDPSCSFLIQVAKAI